MAKTFKDLKPGDEVYVVRQTSRWSSPREPEYLPVTKIGRQYGYVQMSAYASEKFCLASGVSVHIPNHNQRTNGYGFDVFLSKEHYEEWKYAQDTINKCNAKCYKFFGGYGRPALPLAAAEEILAIFDKYELER